MELLKRKVKVIILSGKARSGKDIVADLIVNFYNDKKVKKLSYAYYLKQYVKNICSWDGSEDSKPRELLQFIGVDLIKNKIDDKLLINRVVEDIKFYSYFYDIIVITDARLLDEIEIPKSVFDDVISIRINRDFDNHLSDIEKKHITEVGLDSYQGFDYIIDNNDEIDELKNKVFLVLEELDNE